MTFLRVTGGSDTAWAHGLSCHGGGVNWVILWESKVPFMAARGVIHKALLSLPHRGAVTHCLSKATTLMRWDREKVSVPKMMMFKYSVWESCVFGGGGLFIFKFYFYIESSFNPLNRYLLSLFPFKMCKMSFFWDQALWSSVLLCIICQWVKWPVGSMKICKLCGRCHSRRTVDIQTKALKLNIGL